MRAQQPIENARANRASVQLVSDVRATPAIKREVADGLALPLRPAPAGALFSDWQIWCEQTGERGFSQKRFTQQLEARGFERARTSRAKRFNGLGLRDGSVPDVPGSPIFPVSRAPACTPYIGENGTSGTTRVRAQ